MRAIECGHPDRPHSAKGMCQPCYAAAWYAANRERRTAAAAAWYAANRERKAASAAAWESAHPGYRAAWQRSHPEQCRSRNQRRRARKAGVVEIDRLDKTLPCGICGTPIDHSLPYPDPMSPSIGHEPPLVLQPKESVIRYEHLRCNLFKGTLTDDELLERMAP